MSVINGITVADDNNFAPSNSIVRAGEMTNGLGQTIGDFVRTKYTLSYKWDELPKDVLTALLTATNPTSYLTFSVTHPTLAGDYTGTYEVISPIQGEKLQYSYYLNRIVWVNVTLTLEEV